ncbi:MAG TPA: hypothetical protein VHE30_15405 [Polyangiaceae bacterium]|nr:hypothetical protein [Polyangiaceae bacterium]
MHYQSKDLSSCPPVAEFTCAADQNGFYNACGCGCIDKGTTQCNPDPDPRIHFTSRDPAACSTVTLQCTPLQQPFDNSCGCGCIDP